MDLETTSEQRLRFLLDLARALLNSIFNLSSEVRVEADNEEASFDDEDDGERGGEECLLRRFAAGCLNRSIRVLEEEDGHPFISAFSELFSQSLSPSIYSLAGTTDLLPSFGASSNLST